VTFLPDLATHGGRRAWAFAALLGGCVVMTLFAAVGVWLVRANVGLSFWLAMAAHAQILVGLTMFGALFVRRTIKVDRSGIEISDALVHDPTLHDGEQATMEKEAGR
jgi:hypothetical protein